MVEDKNPEFISFQKNIESISDLRGIFCKLKIYNTF